ncbi:MAG TPA: serine/threonine-protein kinase [Vicinamibacterales bacterium]|nr:serine/threonine-protein kinase [Vicinamibacterales bacterium]
MSGLSDTAIARLKAAVTQPGVDSDRYTILDEIGHGGMGTVYRALDRDLGREVAIKIPRDAANRTLAHRLTREAQVLARLEHPGIVPIHDTGRLNDGRAFYVMKRVRGVTLREHLQANLDLSERLRIFERICEPVAFAHAHGCIHRDLKPDNVMLGAFGEVLVMDWGVAKVVGPEDDDADPAPVPAGATGPGTVVGTHGFMAPEQARGTAALVDRRADVYGLGAILFLLLTGEEPGSEAAGRIAGRSHIPRALRSICTRALAPEPSARYGSVEALANDVARFRAGQAVLAHRETPLERAARFGRTYRTAVLLVLAYIVMRTVVAFLAG